MTDHIIDLSEEPAYLRTRHQQLVIERKDASPVTVPLNETAVLILAHPQITATLGMMSLLMEKGGSIIVCDRSSLPVGLMLGTRSHTLQAERFLAQASAPRPMKKRIWKQIVIAKIRAQGRLLSELHGNDYGLQELARTVRSGDTKNVEAQASRRYWPALFQDDDFRRRRDLDDQNRFLNYGYAVLRAITGRAITGAGLHASLGVHHHNRYNAFCLADDLMEPFRPIVDAAIAEYVNSHDTDAPLDKHAKQAILEALTSLYRSGREARTIFDWMARAASSLARVFTKEVEILALPEELHHARDQSGTVGV